MNDAWISTKIAVIAKERQFLIM